MNQRAVLAAAEADPKYKRKRQCEAYFFVGQNLLLHGRKDAATRMFQAAVGTGATNAAEYDGPKAELRRLGH